MKSLKNHESDVQGLFGSRKLKRECHMDPSKTMYIYLLNLSHFLLHIRESYSNDASAEDDQLFYSEHCELGVGSSNLELTIICTLRTEIYWSLSAISLLSIDISWFETMVAVRTNLRNIYPGRLVSWLNDTIVIANKLKELKVLFSLFRLITWTAASIISCNRYEPVCFSSVEQKKQFFFLQNAKDLLASRSCHSPLQRCPYSLWWYRSLWQIFPRTVQQISFVGLRQLNSEKKYWIYFNLSLAVGTHTFWCSYKIKDDVSTTSKRIKADSYSSLFSSCFIAQTVPQRSPWIIWKEVFL